MGQNRFDAMQALRAAYKPVEARYDAAAAAIDATPLPHKVATYNTPEYTAAEAIFNAVHAEFNEAHSADLGARAMLYAVEDAERAHNGRSTIRRLTRKSAA